MTDLEPDDSFELPTLSPGLLARSFLNVASGFIAVLLMQFLILVGLAYFFFPDTFAALTGDPEVLKQRLAEDSRSIFPLPLFVPVLVLHSIVSVGIGWLVARLAPIAPFQHAVILAVLLFVSFLQSAYLNESGDSSVGMAWMIATPLAILFGGHLFVSRHLAGTGESDLKETT